MIAADTNVLVYAADSAAGERYQLSRELLGRLLRARRLFLPLQVLGEFYHTARRKLDLSASETQAFVAAWSATAELEGYTFEDIEAAMHAHAEHGLPFWDALLWAVCARAGVTLLASEDFQNGRTLGRVTFLDPFDPANAVRLGLG